jgi:hypothetical protein
VKRRYRLALLAGEEVCRRATLLRHFSATEQKKEEKGSSTPKLKRGRLLEGSFFLFPSFRRYIWYSWSKVNPGPVISGSSEALLLLASHLHHHHHHLNPPPHVKAFFGPNIHCHKRSTHNQTG